MSATAAPQLNLQQLGILVEAQAAVRERNTKQAIAIATTAAQRFRGWYDSEQISEWAAKLATLIEGLQRAQAQSTDAYMSTALSQMLGERVKPVGRINVAGLRKEITHAGAYARAADVYRWQQHEFDQFAGELENAAQDQDKLTGLQPLSLVKPVDAAIQRVIAVADTDIQLADSHQSRANLEARTEISGWRRVIHPELSKTGTCGLCIAASDRIYHVSDLRPLHTHCACTTMPIVGSMDPGSSLNNLDLEKLYKRAGSTSGRALKKTRYSIDEHGELGPVLTDGTFRTPATVRRARQRRPESTPEQQHANVVRILQSQEAAHTTAQQLAKDDPQKWGEYASQLDERIESLRSQLAA